MHFVRCLLAAAEPHGQVFTVTEIIGQANESNFTAHQKNNGVQMQNVRPTRDSLDSGVDSSKLIECDKKYLAWGGIDIGSVE